MVEGGNQGETTSATTTSSSRLTSSFVKIGDRTRFTVELRPGETTIVSWKKLVKDAAKAEGNSSSAAAAATATATAAAGGVAPPVAAPAAAVAVAPQAVPNSVPALEARLSPGQPATNELDDAPAPNRFSAVIEKIERLYTGKDSSDEEDLDDIPDDDQYDTEDSFIDDAELDEYFEVDKSKTKHDGYFVNRGTLEKVEPVESANQQPKKRRRKEVAKAPGDNPDGQRPSKNLKVGKKGGGKSAVSVDKDLLPTPQGSSLKSSEDLKLQNHQKTGADRKSSLDSSSLLKMSHGDTPLALAENSDKHKTGIVQAKNSSSKLKDGGENGDKIEYLHKSQPLKTNHIEESESTAHQKDKSGMRERIDLNLPDHRQTIQPTKTSGVKKEGSSVKPKANLLEKAVRELEKMVAESRPPATDAPDADSSGQAIKRRLPREIKQKLAKVARLSHASNGKVSDELLNRLMGILGHLIQVRTLKRHLKIMMTMGLSAKQEKDDKFQLTKKEVIEMIKARIPSLMSKAAEQQIGGSGNFQESGQAEKALKGQHCMDTTLEDKICDLYDIFVDGLDEDATPQVRKLYAELAELWPKGVMDNHGIKRAICRAKERKRTLNENNKDQEKVKRKKVPAVSAEEIVRVESTSAVQSQYVDVKVVSDPCAIGVSQQNRFSTLASNAPAPGITTASAINTPGIASSVSLPSTDVFTLERLKQEKSKATQKNSLRPEKIVDVGVKKKVKKKAGNLMGELPLRPEKLSSHQGDDRQKQHKHASGQLQNVSVTQTQVTMNSDMSR